MNRSLLTFAAIGLTAALTAIAAPGSQAQTFPSEPITLSVAWPAGGRQRHQHAAARRCLEQADQGARGRAQQARRRRRDRPSRDRQRQARRLHHRHVQLRAASRCPISMRRQTPSTSCSRSPSSARTPTALQVSIASGIGSLKEYIERARANPGKIKNGNDQPGARRSSPSRSMKRCWASKSPACPMQASVRPSSAHGGRGSTPPPSRCPIPLSSTGRQAEDSSACPRPNGTHGA